MTFRMVVVVLTTIGGATLLGLGAGASLLQVEAWREGILRSLTDNPLIFPVMVGCAAGMGAVYQLGGGVKGLNERANKADPKKAPKARAA
jgi:ABC-type transport system involved in cytochrome c biogenesis permease component